MTALGVWGYVRYLSPVLEDSPQHTLAQAESQAGENATSELQGSRPSRRERTLIGRESAENAIPRLTSRRPEVSDGGAGRHVSEKGAKPEAQGLPDQSKVAGENRNRAIKLFAAGMKANAGGELILARGHLTDAVQLGLPRQDLIQARATLTKIGSETIFGPAIVDGDPYVSRYTIQSGDSLGKIAKRYSVTDDFLASINNIANKNQIRLGQNIKVVRGPFHVRIDKATFSLDVYLDRTFVRHYSVGLGKNGGTPPGQWVVGDKMVNPTYFPPRGGKVMAADDPLNPLGERWIQLKGVAGAALGQTGFGIHGTIEPDSIGRNESMGCVRMHNEDVAELFTFLASQQSSVTILSKK